MCMYVYVLLRNHGEYKKYQLKRDNIHVHQFRKEYFSSYLGLSFFKSVLDLSKYKNCGRQLIYLLNVC